MQPDLVSLIWPTVAEGEKLRYNGWLTFRTISLTFDRCVCEHIVIVARTLVPCCVNIITALLTQYVNIISPISEYSVSLHHAFPWHDIA